MAASQNGHVEVVDKLLQYGANVDLQKKVPLLFRSTDAVTKYGSTLFIGMDEVLAHYACTFENSNLHLQS